MAIQAHKRYTAKDACRHPWITRNQLDQIPKSFIDELNYLEQSQILKQKMRLMFFLSIIKQNQRESESFDEINLNED
jgi:hypothetical protein